MYDYAASYRVIVVAASVFAILYVAWAVLRTRRRRSQIGSFSTRKVISNLLVCIGIIVFVETLLWWNIYGTGPDWVISYVGFFVSIGFFLAGVLVSR